MPKTRFDRFLLLTLAAAQLTPQFAWAHCDTLDGPVVIDARAALAAQDVTPVFKWVRAEDEAEIRAAFAQTLKVRHLDGSAQELADRYFFETLVRAHRVGEGAPYTGLKAGATVPAPIAKADRALEQGSVDPLAKAIAGHGEQGIRDKFAAAHASRQHAADSIVAGRAFVADYVTYVHYVEGIVEAVHAGPHHGAPKSERGGGEHAY